MRPWQKLPPLVPGDRIGIVAPGGALPPAGLDAGCATLRAMGLEPVYTSEIYARHGYFAGPDTRRAREFETALYDPSLRGIWAARGGYGAARLLPGLDPDKVAQSGKWLVGFSDISALHALWARARLPSVHAVTVNKLATWAPAAQAALRGCLMEGRVLTLRGASAGGRAGRVQGRVYGGNLTVLASLAGTGFLPTWHDGIVFLEDVGEAPYRLHRAATQLLQAQAFDGVRAVLIGQLTDCPKPPKGQPVQPPYTEVVAMLAEVLAPAGAPVVAGFPVGHEAGSWPLPFGTPAELDVATATLTVDAEA